MVILKFRQIIVVVSCVVCAQSDDSSELKLDFTFDAELAKLTDDKSDLKPVIVGSSIGPALPISLAPPSGAASSHILSSLQSPATDELGYKIASVKNVWDGPNPDVAKLSSAFDQRFGLDCLVYVTRLIFCFNCLIFIISFDGFSR